MHMLGTSLFVIIFICLADSDNHNIQAVRAKMYFTLRNVAFPNSPYSASETTHNRFILMSPGKVLNYYDYYPGDEYTASFKDKNFATARENLVPPSIMEKWFDISDVVVSGNLDGGITTGKQLSVIYQTILSQMTVKNFKKLYIDGEAKYNEASRFLTEPVQNPVNLTKYTTRMFLYSFYQEEYVQTRLNMEETINSARKLYSSLEYQLWFQRTFRLLNSKVESAYTKWHVFGKKDLVEMYKTYLETASTNPQLEDAKVLLRSSGVSSLDRTRTIYPVSFEPSNWYEYLRPKKVLPSRDMLLTKKSLFQSQRDVLIAILEYDTSGGNTNTAIKPAELNVNYTIEERNNALKQALNVRNDCLEKNAKDGMPETKGAATKDPCEKFKEKMDNVVNTTFQEAQAKSEFLSLSFLLKLDNQYQIHMRSRIRAIDREIEKINAQLNSSRYQTAYLGDIVDSLQVDTLEAEDHDNNWMKFEYYHNSSEQVTDKTTVGVSLGVSASISTPKIGAKGSRNIGVDTAFVNDLFKQSNLKLSGELLRVTIKRPWFRPSLFENPLFYFIQADDTGETTYVSPPPSSEEDLRKYINGVGRGGNHYLLPEYVTSFLLARRLKIEFSDLEMHFASKAVQVFTEGSATVTVLQKFGFGLSHRVSVGREHTTITRTATGFTITIQGVQLIGYYTQVMPEFPRGQK